MSAFLDTASNFHPYECDGPGKCVHCDRKLVTEPAPGEGEVSLALARVIHDPGTCALCDPDYDGQPNRWRT